MSDIEKRQDGQEPSTNTGSDSLPEQRSASGTQLGTVIRRFDAPDNQGGIIGMLARHRTAANLLMVMLILGGLWAITRLQTQVFPDASRDIIRVTANWDGATAEDIDSGIIEVLEPQLRFLEKVDTITSTSSSGRASISLAYIQGSDMKEALSDVESVLSQISSYPEGADDPKAARAIRYETISKIVLSGPYTESALQEWAIELRDSLLNSGIERIELKGLRGQEIVAEIPITALRKSGLTLDQIAGQIRASSTDIPAGEIGGGRSLVRSLGQIENAQDLADIEVVSQGSGASLRLSDLAVISEGFNPDQTQLFRNGNPAIEVHIQRSLTADSLTSSALVDEKLAEWQATAPETLSVERYEYQADILRQRIGLLVKNGIGGMLLVLLALFLFMNTRSAIWVAAGIPTSLLITMGIMLMMGVTINMISLFAMLLTLGIIVDDAIVVSEHSETLWKRGFSPEDAAIRGSSRMFYPVLSSSLTTIAAFLPLLLIGGFFGRFVKDIPIVVTIVIVASLIECFLILPGHMRHSFHALSKGKQEPTALRKGIDAGFAFFQTRLFVPMVRVALKLRYAVIALAGVSFFWSIMMISAGEVRLSPRPDFPEGDRVSQSVRMVAGATREQTQTMLNEIERAFWVAMDKQVAEKGLPEPVEEDFMDRIERFIVEGLGREYQPEIPVAIEREQNGRHPVVNMALAQLSSNTSARFTAELVPGDQRNIRNREFVQAWQREINRLGPVETLASRRGRFGSSATDISFEIKGTDLAQLKDMSLKVQAFLTDFGGLTGIEDNLPYGTPEKVIELNAQGAALGFRLNNVGQQLRTAINGVEVESLPNSDRETSVQISLPVAELADLSLEQTPIATPSGQYVSLGDIANITDKVGLSSITRVDGQRLIAVTADLEDEEGDATVMMESLIEAGIGDLVEREGMAWEFGGDLREGSQAFGDLGIAFAIAAIAIYAIMAWVFGSYFQPFIVLLTVPLGFVGAVYGLWSFGYSVNILVGISMVGLSGIVVNDSIILVTTINELKERMPTFEAIVAGASERLRAVILTSATTIGGLTPLLFETSRQAQFLIPMAVVMVFGLAFATLLVLFFVPALTGILTDIENMIKAVVGSKARADDEYEQSLEKGRQALGREVSGAIRKADA